MRLLLFLLAIAQDPQDDYDKKARRAAPRDAFPVLNDPKMTKADEARDLRDDDRVIGLVVEKEAKAYPISVMGVHELGNDTCGGIPIAVSWWPLCQTAIVYGRKLGGRTLTFGHEGVLYKNSFIMYDKETDSLWVHTTGEAIRGELKGEQLNFIPSVVTTWKKWKTDHPETTVLLGRKARGMMGAFSLERDFKRYGLSVGQGRSVKLYPFEILKDRRVVNDEFEGQKIVVVFDADSSTGAAFERGDLQFEWKDGAVRDASGAEWTPLLGTSKGGKSLTAVPATPWLTERWRGFYPKGEVFRP